MLLFIWISYPKRLIVARKTNTMLIGSFVGLGLLLLIVAVLLFSKGNIFAKKIKFYAFFDASLNGLDVGAPVKFKGVRVGTVESIEIIYDDDTDEASAAVLFSIDANLFQTVRGNRIRVDDYELFYHEQISRGLAAKLSMESIVTGKLYVGLDYEKNNQVRHVQEIAIRQLRQMPTVTNSLDEFKESFDAVMKRLSRVEFEKISKKIISVLDNVNKKIDSVDFSSINDAMSAISDVLAFDSDTRQSLDNCLRQCVKTLRSLRVLLDYIERNPNALVAGKAL